MHHATLLQVTCYDIIAMDTRWATGSAAIGQAVFLLQTSLPDGEHCHSRANAPALCHTDRTVCAHEALCVP